MVQPLVFPFAFAVPEGAQLDFTTLLNEAVWQRLVQSAALADSEPVDGHECTVIDVTRRIAEKIGHTRLYLANDLNYFPVREVLKFEGVRTEMHNSFTSVDTDRGRVTVPVEVNCSSFATSGELVLTENFTIDPASLEINQIIDPIAFTIPPSRAWNGVVDEDNNIRTMPIGNTQDHRLMTMYLIFANVTLAVVVIALIILRRTKNAKFKKL